MYFVSLALLFLLFYSFIVSLEEVPNGICHAPRSCAGF